MPANPAPRWMRLTLVLAGVYNLAWGGAVVLFPAWTFRVGGLLTPEHAALSPNLYLHLWRCIGMVVGVYGVGYLVAARDPLRHWPVVLVGFLGKLLGPAGALAGVLQGELPATILRTNLTNDLIWLVPFALILRGAARHSLEEGNTPPPGGLEGALAEVRSQQGASLAELSATAPTLVVFLRQFG